MSERSWDDLASLEPKANANNLLLIDGNNLAYRWIGRKNYGDFGDDFISTAQSLGKSYDASRVICCFDFGKSYYRLEVYPEYKSNRKPPTDEDEKEKFDKFFGCLNDLIDQLPLEYYKFRGVEADDIIAFLAINCKAYYDHVWIVSSDRDLYQLLDDDVSIFNLYSRKEISIDTLIEDHGATVEEYLLAKIIEGDKGDGIHGIEGIGPKRAMTLAIKYGTLEALIEALPIKGSTAKYMKNLNAGKDILLMDELLINLIDHHEVAIKSGKHGEEDWNELERAAFGG